MISSRSVQWRPFLTIAFCRPCRGSNHFFNLPGAWGFASCIRSLATPSRVERYRALTPGYYSCTPPGRQDSFAYGSPPARQTSILCFAKAIFFNCQSNNCRINKAGAGISDRAGKFLFTIGNF